MLPNKITTWLKHKTFPQRIILSGHNKNINLAIELASKLQNTTTEEIEKGIHLDTQIFRDNGQSFKLGEDSNDQASVRGMIKWSKSKPTSPHRIIILENLERASHQAPQALLKLIEEPPPHSIFIFTTKNHHQLLDTILSRMTVIRIPHEKQDFEISDEIQNFLAGKNTIEKFQLIESLTKKSKEEKDKTAILKFIDQLIHHARFFTKHHKALDHILQTQQAIKQNQNPRLTLEHLALTLTNQ